MEQKSGTLHLFNLSNFEFVGFQILMIWDLWAVNFHTVAVLALIFHLWFKLLSALCEHGPKFHELGILGQLQAPSKKQKVYFTAYRMINHVIHMLCLCLASKGLNVHLAFCAILGSAGLFFS